MHSSFFQALTSILRMTDIAKHSKYTMGVLLLGLPAYGYWRTKQKRMALCFQRIQQYALPLAFCVH